ncbi:helix-turn-helix domain-containing protein [Streptomyces sp. NPDC046465]|uniref:helix-turn-helix domain-containing protein n=1 Tax=Streptomyces sp. NPDC046465 TaxID=3155810 RepID=UPI00340AE6F3
MKEQPQPPEVRTLDARSLRGLAHPLRMRLMASLRLDGPSTASQLAARLGESSGSTSYHLRQLATHGFVEDDPDHGKGRERWWRSTHQGTHFSETLRHDPDPVVRGAANLYLHEHAMFHTEELTTYLGTLNEWSEEWTESADLSDFTLRLTPELTAELHQKMHALVESYRERAVDEDTPGSAQVRLHTHLFPTRPTE